MGFQRRAHVILAVTLVLAAFLLVEPPKAIAQNPIEPDSSRILGYIHLYAPDRLATKAGEVLGQTGRWPQADAFKKRICSIYGDVRMALLPRDAAMTIAWVETQYGSISQVTVLDEVKETDYFRACLEKVKKTHMPKSGLSFIGERNVVEDLGDLEAPLRKIHQAIHPADLSCYFTGTLLTKNKKAILERWADLRTWNLSNLLRFLLEPPPEEPPPTYSTIGVYQKPAKIIPMELHIAGRIADELESIHILAEIDKDPARLVVNITAREGTALAAFCNQPAPSANPLARFLPNEGWLRACVSVDGKALAALAKAVVPSAAQGNAFPAQTASALTEITDALAPFKDASAVSLRPPQLGKLPSRVFILSPQTPGLASNQIKTILEKIGLFRTASPAQPIALKEGMEKIENFPIDFFFNRPGAAAPGQAFMSASQPGAYYVLTNDRVELDNTINRVLRLKLRLSPPLYAQALFLDKCHLYADFRPHSQAFFPWDPSTSLALMGRVGDGRAQLVIAAPHSSLAALPR